MHAIPEVRVDDGVMFTGIGLALVQGLATIHAVVQKPVTCDAALGDARCGVDLEDPAFKGTGTVIDLLRDRAFTASGLGDFEAGWFTFGTIEWTSGSNAGRRAEVLGHVITDGIAVLTLLEAPVRAIAEDDAFIIRAGCDKLIETCGAKFANTANFRGFPHIPGQDTILRYATKDGGHDGGVL
jgi:uncharacterized phage protein (TIGR02218 family)